MNGAAPRCPECSRSAVMRPGEDAPSIHHKPSCSAAPREIALSNESTFLVLATRASAVVDQLALDVEVAGLVTDPGDEPEDVDATDPAALAEALRRGALLSFRLPMPSAAAMIVAIIRGSLEISPHASMALLRTVESMLPEIQAKAAQGNGRPASGLVLPPGFVVPGQG